MKTTTEMAQELHKKGFYDHDPGTLKIMLDLQRQLEEVLAENAENDTPEKFNRHIFQTSELLGMTILATVARGMEDSPHRQRTMEWLALHLLAGMESAIISSIREFYRTDPEALYGRLDSLHKQAKATTNSISWSTFIENLIFSLRRKK